MRSNEQKQKQKEYLKRNRKYHKNRTPSLFVTSFILNVAISNLWSVGKAGRQLLSAFVVAFFQLESRTRYKVSEPVCGKERGEGWSCYISVRHQF